jgi:iron complex outermembrane receptor protein
MLRFSLVGIFAMFSLCSFAQFTLSGKVTDATGLPLAGVNIVLQNSFSGTISQPDGNFAIKQLPSGKYTLQITSVGYEKWSKEVDLQKDTYLEIALSEVRYIADEVVVTATRASEKSPTTFTNISKQELAKQNLGQDLPVLLNQTPSVVVNSDAGAGVGYTGIRIRGSDPTRVNVTVNGIPMNDAESHGVFWVNMPDFTSSVESIQIQRGVGTSTNGAGAFGATVNIQTNSLNQTPYGEVSNSFGSFGTRKHTIKAGTGLLDGKWAFDARLSKVASDGFIDRAFSDLSSYFVSGGYYGKKSLVKVNVFSGKEQTYQAWNGIPEAKLSGDKTALTNHYYNNLGTAYITPQDSVNLFSSNPRTFNQFTYQNQTDNYKQDHYQLFFSQEIGKFFTLNTALHYTKGKGYYEEYKANDSFSKYNLPAVIVGDDTIARTDIIRRRWLDNDFYGIVYSLNYQKQDKLTATIGGGYNVYKGDHFGEIIWARFAGNTNIRDKYYLDDATKKDFNIYGKVLYSFSEKLTGFADLQYRFVDYSFLGFNQVLQNVQQDAKLNFFNPKAGFSYKINSQNNLYASYSVGHREPTRDDYTNSTPQSRPKAEALHNVEVGYKTQSRNYSFSVNYFLMSYKNQLVLTGKINDVGAYTRTNIDKSYRSGIELETSWRFAKAFLLSANATFSRNKVKNYREFIDNYDTGIQQEKSYSTTDISFSPNVIAAGNLAYSPVKGLNISWISKYVGKQYLDNTSDEKRKLNAFFVNNLLINYTIKPKFIKEIGVNLLLNNIFSEQYEPNGYTFSYIYGGQTTTENYYYPQAGFNFLAGLTLKF